MILGQSQQSAATMSTVNQEPKQRQVWRAISSKVSSSHTRQWDRKWGMKRKSEVRLFFSLTAWVSSQTVLTVLYVIWQVPKSTCHFVDLSPWLFIMMVLVLKSILRASTHPPLHLPQRFPCVSEGFLLFPPDGSPSFPAWDRALSWDLLPVDSRIPAAHGRNDQENFYHSASAEPNATFSGKFVQSVFHLEIFLSCLTLGVFRLPFILFLFLPCWAESRGCHGHKTWDIYSKMRQLLLQTNCASKC